MTLNNSSRHALRTGLQVLIAILTAIPSVLGHLPADAVLTQIGVVTVAASKAINQAEDSGLLPVWLNVKPTAKQTAVVQAVSTGVYDVAEKLGGPDPAP